MKPSPSKSTKTAGKKRGRDEAAAAATGAAPPMSPPWSDPSREWKKSKTKTEDLLALLNSGFIREKEMDSWSACNTLILLKFWLYKNLLATIYLPKEYKVVLFILGIQKLF
jgi:hypothetical protein